MKGKANLALQSLAVWNGSLGHSQRPEILSRKLTSSEGARIEYCSGVANLRTSEGGPKALALETVVVVGRPASLGHRSLPPLYSLRTETCAGILLCVVGTAHMLAPSAVL